MFLCFAILNAENQVPRIEGPGTHKAVVEVMVHVNTFFLNAWKYLERNEKERERLLTHSSGSILG